MNCINMNTKHCRELLTSVQTALQSVASNKWSQTATAQSSFYIQPQIIRNVTSATWNACTISTVSIGRPIISHDFCWIDGRFQHCSTLSAHQKVIHISQMMSKVWVAYAYLNVNRLIIVWMYHRSKECR